MFDSLQLSFEPLGTETLTNVSVVSGGGLSPKKLPLSSLCCWEQVLFLKKCNGILSIGAIGRSMRIIVQKAASGC